jgi:hypothetical protein
MPDLDADVGNELMVVASDYPITTMVMPITIVMVMPVFVVHDRNDPYLGLGPHNTDDGKLAHHHRAP